jgi:RNA methyltransferase, TrmH family
MDAMNLITSLQHPIVKHLVKLRTNRSYRTSEKRVLIVGDNLVKEIPLKILFAVDVIPPGIKAEKSYVVTAAIMKKITGLEHPEGLAAEVEMPPEAAFESVKRLLVLDGVSDPGNMGTLIRTALALGWEGAYITANSCDPFNDKALRAAKGATFRLPLSFGSWDDLRGLLSRNQITPLAADMGGVNIQEIKRNQGIALILGNEARGISSEAESLCTKVAIPMSGKMESLNVAVAGGILMYCLEIQ